MRTILSGLMAAAVAATGMAISVPANATPMVRVYGGDAAQVYRVEPVHWRRHHHRPYVRYYNRYRDPYSDPYYYRGYHAFGPYYERPYYPYRPYGWRRYHRPGFSIQFGF
jgi:hypothetical protein